MDTHLLFPKVLRSEGSQVWLRGLGSAAICQNSAIAGEGKRRAWLFACTSLPVSLTYHSLPVDEIPALISSLVQAWMDLLRWRTVRVQCVAAAGHTLNSPSSARKTGIKQHLDLRTIWLFNELTFSRIWWNPTAAVAALKSQFWPYLIFLSLIRNLAKCRQMVLLYNCFVLQF